MEALACRLVAEAAEQGHLPGSPASRGCRDGVGLTVGKTLKVGADRMTRHTSSCARRSCAVLLVEGGARRHRAFRRIPEDSARRLCRVPAEA